MNNFDRAEKACYDRLKAANKEAITIKEVKLEKKLDIAVKALEYIKFISPCCYTKCECPILNKNAYCPSEERCFAKFATDALEKIEEE